MVLDPTHKKPGDLIRSHEWNQIVDELIELRKYIENMTQSITLTSLESPIGTANILTRVPDEFDYGIDVMGLITKQYYLGEKETGDICKFGIHDFAEIIYYWSGAEKAENEVLKIVIEYLDGTIHNSEPFYIHEWKRLLPKGNKNPYTEYLQSPNQRLWYKYGFVNPNPDKKIRYITFVDVSEKSSVRIANMIQYLTRLKPLKI